MSTSRTITPLELEAYCDGELPEADHRRISAAIDKDEALRAQFQAISDTRRRLAVASTEGDADDPALSVLVGKLERELQVRRRWWFLRTGAALGVMVTLVGAAGWYGHARYAPAGPTQVGDVVLPGFVADAAGAHSIFAFDSVHPVEFTSSDENTMRDWFKFHLGKTADVPNLREFGFTLVGGRLLGDADGAMAQILYENEQGDRVSLVLGKRPTGAGKELRLVKVGKSFASYWSDDELSWAVVENAPGADINSIATHVAGIVRERRN
ncbi:MAG: anti-sigma factor [Pseudomonadota bacterium]